MDRLRKVKLNINIDPVLKDNLEKLSLHTGFSNAKIISYAVQKLLDDLKTYKANPIWIQEYKPENYYPDEISRRL